ncbi:MAG: two-component regulator propeller domain-containing protein [Flavobacteriales bacterium]
MRKILLLFISVLCTCIALAQSGTIAFQHYGLSDGMSDNSVTCVHFDKKGFLWMGTNEGLNRFDGESFFALNKNSDQKESICGNSITAIEEDASGNLWIGTRDGGICRLNNKLKTDRNPPLINSNGQQIYHVHDLLFDRDSTLYVASEKGLFYSFPPYDQFTESTPSIPRACYSLIQSADGVLTSFITLTLMKLNKGEGNKLTYRPYPEDGHTMQFFFRTLSGKIVSGGWDPCLHQYSEKDNLWVSKRISDQGLIAQDDEIVSITEATPDVLWLGMKSGKILRHDLQHDEYSILPISEEETKRLNGKRIFCMYTDPFQRTWIGTDVGLHVYNPLNSLFNVQWLPDNTSKVITFASAKNDVLVGTSNGLFKVGNTGLEKQRIFNQKPYSAHSIFPTKDHIYVGTTDNLMELTGGILNPLFAAPPDNMKEIESTFFNTISEVSINNKNYLLANPYGHGTFLASLEDNDWVGGVVMSNGKIDHLINNILRDSKSRTWFLGTSSGISLFESCTLLGTNFPSVKWDLEAIGAEAIHFNTSSYTQAGITPEISAMIENADGTFWVGTLGSGLLLFDPEKDSRWYTPVENSPSSVYQLAKDRQGFIWMTARGGIFSFNPATYEWQKFDEKDGIPSAGLSKSLFMHENGVMYAGGNGFYLSFEPEKKVTNPELPHTVITHIEVMGSNCDSLQYTSAFSLPFDQNFITFHFSSLCFNDGSNSTFEYMLEGLDPAWNSSGTVSFVDYNKLPFGEYTFRVRAISSTGVKDTGEATVRFYIEAPFYFRWWFIGLVLLTIAALGFILIQYRNNQKNKLTDMRDKIARDLHDDVGSALGSISFYSETARKTLLENKTERTDDIIKRMGSTSRQMIENMHDIVWAVQSGNDSVQHLLDRMQSVVAELSSDHNFPIRFECQDDIKSLKMDMNMRKNCYLIFKEAIYNSMKYSKCSEIKIHFYKENRKVILHIEDNGIGFDIAKAHSGNGLKNMSSRAEEMHARLSIQSSSTGTHIDLVLPSPEMGIF